MVTIYQNVMNADVMTIRNDTKLLFFNKCYDFSQCRHVLVANLRGCIIEDALNFMYFYTMTILEMGDGLSVKGSLFVQSISSE